MFIRYYINHYEIRGGTSEITNEDLSTPPPPPPHSILADIKKKICAWIGNHHIHYFRVM